MRNKLKDSIVENCSELVLQLEDYFLNPSPGEDFILKTAQIPRYEHPLEGRIKYP